jgi:adenylate cyclase
MAADPLPPPRARFGLIARVLANADTEAAAIAADPVLAGAVAAEARIGRAIVDNGRQRAMVIIALMLPFLNPNWSILYYEALLGLFWLSGRLRIGFARPGRSPVELAFILFDLLLLVFIATVPNPFAAVDAPGGIGYRFNTFLYFFMILGFATLAYSWRTVWTIGVTGAGLWLLAALAVDLFGHEVPIVAEEARRIAALLGDPVFASFLDLNGVHWSQRVQEAVILIIVTATLTLKGWRSNQLLFREARAAAERANLSRYFSPTMVQRLAQQPSALSQPQGQDVAVIFADLVGFTQAAEAMDDAEVVALLRRFYAAIERAVFDHGGTLDKYLGDGVMATFGTPVPAPDDAARALTAVHAIVAAVDALGLGMTVSVGAHFGRATVGDVGPPRRLEFAVIGDTVNVAARLESSTRALGVRAVVSEALHARAAEAGAAPDLLAAFAPCPALPVRGRKGTIDARTLGRAGVPLSAP